MAIKMMEEYLLEAKTYFTEEQWKELDESKQLKYGRICYVYYACLNLEIHVQIPEFMIQRANVGKYICKFCEAVFKFSNFRDKHLQTCRKRFDFIKEKKRYTCNYCNYSTDRGDTLKSHIQTHTKEKRYPCNMCDKVFTAKKSVLLHVKFFHLQEEKKFHCDKCDYKCHRKCDLLSHMKRHSDLKPFICEFCNKGFNTKREHYYHSFKHNNKEKPFNCCFCGKGFVQKSHWTTHLNSVHYKNKDFKCSYCQYATANQYDLRKHVKKHCFSFLSSQNVF